MAEPDLEQLVPKRMSPFALEAMATRGAFLASVRRHAQAIGEIFERQGSLPLHFLVFCTRDPSTFKADPRIYLVPTPPGPYDNRIKDGAAELVRLVSTFGQAIAYVMVSEAWFAAGMTAEEEARYADLGQYPGREEVLMIIAQHREHGAFRSCAPILAGEPRRLGAWSEPEQDHMDGRFVGLLEPLSAEELQALRELVGSRPRN
jgi:hypothetical protein